MNNKQTLIDEINLLKEQLAKLIEENKEDLSNPKILELSQRLDKALNEYSKLSNES